MIHHEYQWKGNNGCYLHGQSWAPNQSPKAVINILHGFGSHSGRFHEWSKKFVEQNYAVVAIDYTGHGKSSGKRGFIKHYNHLLEDVDQLISYSQKLFKEAPAFLYGHSLGGNLALNYILYKSTHLKGIIAASPWIRLTYPPSKYKALTAKWLSFIYPGIVKKANIQPEHLSNNQEVIDAWYEDPLVHDSISPKLYFGVKKAGQFILDNKHKINLPVLLIHGKKDQVASYRATKKLAKNTSHLTQTHFCPHGHHELHHEPNNQEIFECINQWIHEQLNQ